MNNMLWSMFWKRKMKINKDKSVQFIAFRKNGNIIRQPLHINGSQKKKKLTILVSIPFFKIN